MLRCNEIAKILNSDERLSLLKRAELRLHLMMCEHCAAYSKHLNYLKTGFKKLFSHITRIDPSRLESLEDKTIQQITEMSRR